VLGVGLFLSYARPPLVLYGTLWILLLAFVTNRAARRLPASAIGAPVGAHRSRGRQPHPRLDPPAHVARHHGTAVANERDRDWCFIFVGVIRELSAAIMLFTSETKVISVLIFDLNESGDLGAISVLGLNHALITFAVVIAVNRIPAFGDARLRKRLIHGTSPSKDLRRRDLGAQGRGARAAAPARAGARKCEESAHRRHRPASPARKQDVCQGGAGGWTRRGHAARSATGAA